jgi:hypothetical protein
MAIIQIKRRTSSGTGPIVGTSGSIKAGEPLVDLNGGNLYVSKLDKTGSSSNPILLTDYIEYLSKPNATSLIDSKISDLSLGTASKRNTGTSNGTVPLIGADGKLPTSVIPNISPVTSVNSKTGAVTITLSDLGGVSTTTYNAHVSSNVHLTDTQRTKLNNIRNVSISQGVGSKFVTSKSTFDNSIISNAISLYNVLDDNYTPAKMIYYFGIDSSKVLTPTSTIDGGTY